LVSEAPAAGAATSNWAARFFWTAAIIYVVAFLGYFHSVHLFGTGETPEGRMRRYYLFGTALTPSSDGAFVDLGRRLSRTEHLHQRGPLLAAAGAIWATAILAGDAFLAFVFGRRRLGGWPRLVFAFGLGMGLLSLVVLGLGLAGALTHQSAIVAAGVIGATWVVARLSTFARSQQPSATIVVDESEPARAAAASPGWKTRLLLLMVMALFAVMSLLSSFLPTTDYDALGYHLLAPREWFEAGRIFFLPHNVYASFPFLTEMFHLLGMTVIRDWFAGGLVGQVVLWAFSPIAALSVGLLAARLFGTPTGWAAATIYLTTPWVFRLSAIPYVEGASLLYGALSILALMRARDLPEFLLVGASVGCAASCKYTMLLMIGVPVGAAVAWIAWKQRSARSLVGLALGLLIFFGPWLARNAIWTRNPVYPIGYSLFDGFNLTAGKAAKFAAGHRSTDFSLPALLRYFSEIPVHSDWQSGLVFAFAPLPLAVCLFRRRSRSAGCNQAWALAALMGWQFAAFWLFTHRLDRFWLPLLPASCVLAGAGWAAIPARLRAWLINPLTAVVLLYNFAYCTTSYCALNDYTVDLMEHRRFSKATASKAVQLADEGGIVPRGATVMYVGFAGVYYSDHPFRYNSVFDDPIIEKLAADSASANGLRPLPDLRRRFREAGIHYVVVDWEWIGNYRKPGNYGYSEFVTPEQMKEIVRTGLMWRRYSEVEALPNSKRRGLGLELYQVLDEPAP